MCIPVVTPAIFYTAAAAVALMAGNAAYQSAQVEKDVAKSNARLAQYSAADAERRGNEEAARLTREGRSIADRQRVGLAGHGLDVSFGTPADLQFETGFFAEIDAQTARDNAAREAWARRVQAANFKAQASALHPLQAGISTTVGSFLSFAGPRLASSGGASPKTSASPKAAGGLSFESF